ncbi:cation diffusion facilitator transporter [Clostridia bacterium]|nr:cation diffusion facilitator transporter [Clostridia bacterium]
MEEKLLKLFGSEKSKRDAYLLMAGSIGILMNLLLVAIKWAIGTSANSVALISDALNNLLDAGCSAIVIIGTKLAKKSPDKKHPYGYGRIEYIAELVVSAAILVCGVGFLKRSTLAIAKPQEVHFDVISFWGILFALGIKVFLWRYNKRVEKKINSQMLKAASVDALSDVAISLLTLIVAIVSLFSDVKIDGYMGIIVSLFVMYSGMKLINETGGSILGSKIEKSLADKIYQKVMEQDIVSGAHDLILHNYGPNRHIGSINVGIADSLTVKEVADVFVRLKSEINEEFGISMTLGIYSINNYDEKTLKMKSEAQEIILGFDKVLNIHAFGIDGKAKVMYFDIVLDFEIVDEKWLKRDIEKALKSKFPTYDIMIHVDREYT